MFWRRIATINRYRYVPLFIVNALVVTVTDNFPEIESTTQNLIILTSLALIYLLPRLEVKELRD